MSIVDIPVINSTLVSARLLELRKQFLQNDVELLRREFEVYGVELSPEMLQVYIKTLIIYNANVTWDLKAVSFRIMALNNGAFYFGPITSHLVPIGIKALDPITLSFMSETEARTLLIDHYNSTMSIDVGTWGYSQSGPAFALFENGSSVMSPFSQLSYQQIEANHIAKHGALGDQYNGQSSEISKFFYRRSQQLVKANQNPSLQPKSLIADLRSMFSLNPYTTTGIAYKPYYDYEKIYMAAQTKYFAPFNTAWSQYETTNSLFTKYIKGYSYDYYSKIPTAQPYTNQEFADLPKSFVMPTGDTRTEYQKLFTKDAATDTNAAMKADPIAQLYFQAVKIKEFIDLKGGHKSIVTACFNLIAEAHASAMTTINILNKEYAANFTKSLVVMNTSDVVLEIYVFLDKNFKVFYKRYGVTYPSTKPDGEEMVINNGMNTIVYVPYTQGYINSYAVKGPTDSTYPFYYYNFNATGTTPSHLVKASALLGQQTLRNGFLYQDIEKNFQPTFVNFPTPAIEKLESLATKQMAMYDLLDDVKLKNIYSKAITTQTPVANFNPNMPEYTSTTVYVDMLKTSVGEIPLIHPECEFAIKWQAIHAEFILLSSFYYHQFMSGITSTVTEYNNKVGDYISKILNEMKTLSSTYVAAEAMKLAEEKKQSDMELQLQKLKSGVFIDDQGREYWRPMTADEQIAVNDMILKIETNLAQVEENKRIQAENELRINAANDEVIRINSGAQLRADESAIKQNQANQDFVNNQWIKSNINDLVKPSMKDIVDYSDLTKCTLTESLVAWQNNYPYYIYNLPLAKEIEAMRLEIKNAETRAAENLIQAKINEIKITAALKEMFKIL